MQIINLTQHAASAAQKGGGVVDLQGDYLLALKDALTFDSLPTHEELESRAEYIAQLAITNGLAVDDHEDNPVFSAAMIGGAPFFMKPLHDALLAIGVTPLYAFSIRDSVEVYGVKRSVFTHLGFVG